MATLKRLVYNAKTAISETVNLTTEEISAMQASAAQAEADYWESIPYDEAVDAEIRKRYSISQEFAILRQQSEKPEEYAEYYAYCEECKALVKEKKGIS